MKKFTINCDFGGQFSPFTIWIGNPKAENHPLHFQSDWLSKNRGGTIPAEVFDSISQLREVADKNRVPLADLCVYALGMDVDDASENNENEGDDNENEGDAN